MNNTLTVWADKAREEGAEDAVKEALNRSYFIDKFDPDAEGLDFLFDDETSGRAAIIFLTDDPKAFGIKVIADHAWECVELYQLMLMLFDDDSEV